MQLDLAHRQPSIVVVHLQAAVAMDAPTLSARACERGVRVHAFGARTVRAVTHRDVDRTQCEHAAGVRAALLLLGQDSEDRGKGRLAPTRPASGRDRPQKQGHGLPFLS